MSDKIGATCRNRAQITRAPRLRSDLDLTWSDHKVSDLSKSLIRDTIIATDLKLSIGRKEPSFRRDCTRKQKTTDGDVMLSHSIAVILNAQPYERQNRRKCPGLLDSFAIYVLTQDLK